MHEVILSSVIAIKIPFSVISKTYKNSGSIKFFEITSYYFFFYGMEEEDRRSWGEYTIIV